MKTLELKEATASLADYVPSVELEPLVLLADGKPVAALLARISHWSEQKNSFLW
jgi:hypothetical protein